MTTRVLASRPSLRTALVLAIAAGTSASAVVLPQHAVAKAADPAAISSTWTVQSGDGQVVKSADSPTGKKAAVWRNTTAVTTVSGEGKLVLHAYGEQYGSQAPEVEIKVDGKVIGRNQIVNDPSKGYWEYPTGSALKSGKHKVEVRYFNDYANQGGDRNVHLGWVSLNADKAVTTPGIAPAPAPSAVPTSSAPAAAPTSPTATPRPSQVTTTPSTPQPSMTTPSVPRPSTTAPVVPSAAPTTTAPKPSQPAAPAPVSSSGNPFAHKLPYADPSYDSAGAANARRSYDSAGAAALDKITTGGVALWLGDWDGMGVDAKARNYAQRAASAGRVPVVVTYAIPGRDCGNYSAGGLSPANYNTWTQKVADGLKGTGAVVIIEPDAVAQNGACSGQGDRLGMIKKSVDQFNAAGLTSYIDAGNSTWTDATTMASRLRQAGVEQARGFSTNVSNFNTTTQERSYDENISNQLGGKHYVIDTSRNGVGGNGQWCNPSGRKLGAKPGAVTDGSKQDASLWIKMAGQSDGTCNGGPAAGVFWTEYAIGLAN